MLAWALVPVNPYGYYMLLRIVICGLAAYFTFQAVEIKKIGWAWLLGITAILYNPLITVHLTREVWSFVNLVTIGIFIASCWSIYYCEFDDDQ